MATALPVVIIIFARMSERKSHLWVFDFDAEAHITITVSNLLLEGSELLSWLIKICHQVVIMEVEERYSIME